MPFFAFELADRFVNDPRYSTLDPYCADCLPEFQCKMKAAGRCEHPTVTFVRIIDRLYDPILKARKDVRTNALKGVRQEETDRN